MIALTPIVSRHDLVSLAFGRPAADICGSRNGCIGRFIEG